jgi:hypothetical protein
MIPVGRAAVMEWAGLVGVGCRFFISPLFIGARDLTLRKREQRILSRLLGLTGRPAPAFASGAPLRNRVAEPSAGATLDVTTSIPLARLGLYLTRLRHRQTPSLRPVGRDRYRLVDV